MIPWKMSFGGMLMRIDMHTHTFPDSVALRALRNMQAESHAALFADGTTAGLHASGKRARLDLSVVLPVATSPRQVSSINDHVISQQKQARALNILSFGAAHPDDANWRQELDRIAAAGVRGIKLHPAYQNVDMDDPRYLRMLERAGELQLVVVTHAGLDIGLPGSTHALPKKIRHALQLVGPVSLVCAHMGGWACWESVCDLLSDTSVYLDTAFSLGNIYPAEDGFPWQKDSLKMLDSESFCNLVHVFGADHILFGSDSPWTDPRKEIEFIEALPLPESERNDILGNNAAKLLGLNPPA